MRVSLQIVPFMTPLAFAEQTGLTEDAVRAQLRNGQLPAYRLPTSTRQKDRISNRKKVFVDTATFYAERYREAGIQIA